MNRILWAGLLSVSLLGAAAATGLAQTVIRSGTDIVRVFVTVTDRDGRIVTTLERGEFEVRDEGKPQPITIFDNTPQPVRLIVMLDVSGSMQGNLPVLRNGTQQLLRRLLPEDAVRIGTFGREVTISPAFTRDPVDLLSALPEAIDNEAPTPLWRALDDAMNAFGEGRDQRRAVLVLSDGKDSGPLIGKKWMSQSEVIDRAIRDEVMIYGVGLRSRGNRAAPGLGVGGLAAAMAADLPDPGLAQVALKTGGGYTEVRLGQDLGAAFAAVADELHSQYLLGFDPPKRDGKVHDIDVRVAQRGLTTRARKNYVAPKDQK
jgi:VWFA-related protein